MTDLLHNRAPVPTVGNEARTILRAWRAAFIGALLLAGIAALNAHGPVHEQILLLNAELEQHPDDPARLSRRGELLLLHGLPADAQKDFARVATLRPNDITNDFRLGQAGLELGATNEAVLRLERFVNARPDSIPGHRSLFRALQLAGRPREAAAQLEAAIALSPDPLPDWYLDQARALQAAGAPAEDVLRPLDTGIVRLGPLPALELMGVEVEQQRGATDKALARLDALAARAERKERWTARRGDVLLKAGRTNEARIEFQSALRALDALPDKLRRAWTASELRQQIEAKLAGLPSATEPRTPSTP
ncbi:MAG: tetratricopeptide repeat protein [Verrucomicrobiota bacterium]